MSDFDGNFMEMTSFMSPPSSPILAMLNQTDNGLNPINENFPQANLSRDHSDQSEQRPSLRERLASRMGFNPPTIEIENINPFAAFFRNPTVPSPTAIISPGFSLSALLQSPNMFSDSSQIIPPSLETNYGPTEMVVSSDEGNAAMLIMNNDLPHQPLNVDLPPQNGFYDISIEESVYIPSHEYHVEPFDARIVASESDAVDEVNNDLPLQPLNFDLPSEQDDFWYIPSPESSVEPFSASLLAAFEAVLGSDDDLSHQPLNVDLPLQEDPLGAPLVALFESDAVYEVKNNFPHQQLLNVDLPSQEGFHKIPMEEFIYIPSHVEPFGAPFVGSSESNAIDEINNNLPYQSLNVDMPPQESGAVDEVNTIIIEDEDEDEEKDDEEEDDVHENIDVDELDVRASSSKRRFQQKKFEASNMIGAKRGNQTQKVKLQMESEEDNPDDGFRWRIYGGKTVNGNPNRRRYYKCTSIGCKVKKQVERGAYDDRLVMITYDGIHDHPAPPSCSRSSHRSWYQSYSSMYQNQTNRTTSPLSQRPSSSLGRQTEISELPSLPVNYQNDEPIIDMNKIYSNFGKRLYMDM